VPTSSLLIFKPFSIDWCGDCCYLAVGGAINPFIGAGVIQIFKGNPCVSLPAPTNLHAQKIYQRYPTQVDIVNQLCWNPVPNAVAYNIFANGVLLATIPAPLVCYSQHQICQGKAVTYFVTAVDTNGNQSAPAVITV